MNQHLKIFEIVHAILKFALKVAGQNLTGRFEMQELLSQLRSNEEPDKCTHEVAGHSERHEPQLGLLRDLALTLLRQLELLETKPETTTHEVSTLQDEVRRFEIDLINDALCRTHGHQHKAAQLLGIKPTTLNSKIKRYHIIFPFVGFGVHSRSYKT
jgi:transcriptional regulator with GAF, ATPase, and Fis domain